MLGLLTAPRLLHNAVVRVEREQRDRRLRRLPLEGTIRLGPSLDRRRLRHLVLLLLVGPTLL